MKIIANTPNLLGDDLEDSITKGGRARMAAACCSICGFGALKADRQKNENLLFIFETATFFADDSNFVTRMDKPTDAPMYLHLFCQTWTDANLESRHIVGVGRLRLRTPHRGRRRPLIGRVRWRPRSHSHFGLASARSETHPDLRRSNRIFANISTLSSGVMAHNIVGRADAPEAAPWPPGPSRRFFTGAGKGR